MAPSETFLRLQELGRKSREAGSAVDAAALPSASVLEREFGLFDPTRAGCVPTVDATTGAVSCACAGCERWKRYITGTLGEGWPTFPQYEVITADYVTQLARYLRRRRLEILGADASSTRPLRVLELGAGDGRLTRHLREHLDGHGIEVCATDDHSLGLAKGGRHGVVAADALDAVAVAGNKCGFSREPTTAVSSSSLPGACDVALVCWQPMGVDWTAAIRASASFQEYVLVGEVDDGICGDPLATWGVRVHDSGDSGDFGGGEGMSEGDLDVAYASDGWSRVDVTEELGGRQICRTDERWLMGRRSRTTSFRRMDVDAASVLGRVEPKASSQSACVST